jgi:hypothetical protein
MHLKEHNIVIPIDLGPSNLPMVWGSFSICQEAEGDWFEFCFEVGVLGLAWDATVLSEIAYEPVSFHNLKA